MLSITSSEYCEDHKPYKTDVQLRVKHMMELLDLNRFPRVHVSRRKRETKVMKEYSRYLEIRKGSWKQIYNLLKNSICTNVQQTTQMSTSC